MKSKDYILGYLEGIIDLYKESTDTKELNFCDALISIKAMLMETCEAEDKDRDKMKRRSSKNL